MDGDLGSSFGIKGRSIKVGKVLGIERFSTAV
jgi:hypothetical protein